MWTKTKSSGKIKINIFDYIKSVFPNHFSGTLHCCAITVLYTYISENREKDKGGM